MEIIHQLFRRRAAAAVVVTSSSSTSSTSHDQQQQQLVYYKTAVQLTHLVVNCTLAAAGLYCWYGPASTRPPRWEDCSLLDRWTGFQQFAYFSNIMISYNVWSSYASRTVWGHEDALMTCHHIMVCIIGCLSSYTYYGWNYYAPFFFGVIEISSVPLSLLNAFNIRQDWVKAMPMLHLLTKILFALTFIGARVFLWNSNMHLFFKDTWSLIVPPTPSSSSSSSEITISTLARVVTLLAGDVPALFLTVLQLFWAFKIIEALVEMLVGGKRSKKRS
jgi:hypothetical protein